MNYQNNRFRFDVANPEDNQKISQILESQPFKGNISLIYARRPDAYKSFLKEGRETEIIVCRDGLDKKIVALGAYTIKSLYVNGRPQRVAYLFSLHAEGQYFKTYPLLHKAFSYLYERCKEKHIDFYITTILEGNDYARQLLEKQGKSMPSYRFYGNYEVYALSPSQNSKENHDFIYRRATHDDLDAVVDFLNKEGAKYQFFPIIQKEDLVDGTYAGLSIERFGLVLDKSGTILATGAAWDQREHKQYVVHGYSLGLKWLKKLDSLFRRSFFPNLGDTLNFFTLSFWAVRGNSEKIFNCLLQGLSMEFIQYPFFLVGLDQHHPLKKCLRRKLHVIYKSKAYVIDWQHDHNSLMKVNNSTFYLECGSL